MFVTISGTAASGKSTVARLLVARLGYEYLSMGEMSRRMAQQMGISLEQLNALSEKDPFRDKRIDEFQRELGRTKDNMVIDGRMSFHFIPQSVKIFIDCPLDVRARRIFDARRQDERFESVQEAQEKLRQREDSDRKRYLQYYGIDCFEHKHYDLVLGSANSSPEELLEKILAFLEKL